MTTDTTIPDQLPDGRKVEKVPVTPPSEVAQAFTRISLLTKAIDNAKSLPEAQSFSHQLSLAAGKAARGLKRYAEEHEPKVWLLNVAEEMEVVSALSAKFHTTIKAHNRPTEENAKIRGAALVELSKATKNAGVALHEYLIALGDLQAESEKTSEATAPESSSP